MRINRGLALGAVAWAVGRVITALHESGFTIVDQEAALRAGGSLDEAWAEVEAVLPDGDYRTITVMGYRCSEAGCGQDYHAVLAGPNGEVLDGSAGAGNPTPTLALRALASRLRGPQATEPTGSASSIDLREGET